MIIAASILYIFAATIAGVRIRRDAIKQLGPYPGVDYVIPFFCGLLWPIMLIWHLAAYVEARLP